MSAGFRIFDHTADVGIEVWGEDLASLFAQAGHGLFEILLENPPAEGGVKDEIELQDDAPDLLIRGWLNELLYRFATQGRVYARFEITEITETRVQGRAFGEPYDEARHGLRTDIKAITYHQLSVRRENGGWRGRIIVDI